MSTMSAEHENRFGKVGADLLPGNLDDDRGESYIEV